MLAYEGRRNFFVHTKNSGCRFLLNQKQCLPLQQKLFIKLFNLTDWLRLSVKIGGVFFCSFLCDVYFAEWDRIFTFVIAKAKHYSILIYLSIFLCFVKLFNKFRLSAKVSGFFVVNSSMDFAKRKTILTFAVQQLSNTLPHRMIVNASCFKKILCPTAYLPR